MEIVKNFGFEPILFFAQIINFIILLWILKKFLYRPILQTLKNRQREIQEGLEKTQQAQLLLEKTQKEETKILKNAQIQAQKLLDDAKMQAQDMFQKVEEKARLHSEKVLKDAKEQIEQETKDAESRLTKSISVLAITYLNKAISEIMTPESQEEIMSKALRVLKKKTN